VPLIAIVLAALAVGFEQLVQWKYGAVGIVGLLLLTIGIKAKSPTLSSIGAIVLAAQITAGPAL
jgi:uncharacterized membrane protein YkvI